MAHQTAAGNAKRHVGHSDLLKLIQNGSYARFRIDWTQQFDPSIPVGTR
jgi:hypothetical protein